MLKKCTGFIFYSSIFISVCAVAMCIETNLLLHIPLNHPGLYFFVFGASLVQYNLHYLVKASALGTSSRFKWSLNNAHTHLLVIAAGLLLLVAGLFTFQLRHFIFLFILGIITFLYSFPVLPFTKRKRIKDFGILKILTLVTTWTIVTVWLPVNQAYYADTSFLLIFMRRFIFMFILCLVFDMRDAEIDRNDKINTIPVIAGIRKSYFICYVLLAAFTVISIIQYFETYAASELYAMLASVAATVIVIEYTKKNQSDLVYLAGIDGMMLLQALFVVIGSI